MNVPFLDLKAQYSSIKEEINSAIQEVLDSCAFAGGPFVEKFEKEWAAYCGVKHTVGVGSGTDALWLTLIALGVGPGDEVITVPNTFIATAEAISFTGATPVFVDIDESYYTIDPELLESAITARTKAVIPVHIFGQMADMDPIMETARKNKLYVIEDACQAHGATYRGRKSGSFGDAAAFSFYPGKNLGAYGEAGAVTTNDDEIAAKIRMLRDHGQSKKYYHDIIGWNARMDGIQAAVLSVKMKYIDTWNDKRRLIAGEYQRLLAGHDGIVLPKEMPGCKHVYHIFASRVHERDRLIELLRSYGIGTGIHYPVLIHQNKAFLSRLLTGRVELAEKVSKELLSLPMYPELADNSQLTKAVCERLVTVMGPQAYSVVAAP